MSGMTPRSADHGTSRTSVMPAVDPAPAQRVA